MLWLIGICAVAWLVYREWRIWRGVDVRDWL